MFMDSVDKELLSRIESLLTRYRRFVKDGEGTEQEETLVYGLRGLVNLANMVLRDVRVYGIEPWHVIADDVPLSQPGEMLLRLKNYKGEVMPPYPFIMAFYNNGFTAPLDTILVLAALREFERGLDKPDAQKQVSINVSAISLRDPDFVKVVLARLEAMDLFSCPDEAIIFEIHESTANLAMSRQVLDLFRQVGCHFAIDDVGLSVHDVMRLSEFEGIADYIKIDRHSVCAPGDAPHSLAQVMSYIHSMLPGVSIVAEGVQSAEHALQLKDLFPDIGYVQGLYLSGERRAFQVEFQALQAAQKSV